MQDEQVLRKVVPEGGTQTFEGLYNTHFARLREFLRLYLGDSAIAEDVAQDSLLEFWRRPDNFNPERSSLKAYLYGIARIKAVNWRRKKKNEHGSERGVPLKTEETTALMRDALTHLDPDHRNLLWLREVEGHSYEELARIFEIPLGTVRSRLYAARERLRRIWKATV